MLINLALLQQKIQDFIRLENEKKIDAIIRFFLYVLIFWLPYSPAVVESCVCISLVLWLIKRGLLLKGRPWGEVSSRSRPLEKFWIFLKTFRPQPTFLDVPIICFLSTCLLSIAGSTFWPRSLHGFFTKTLEWFVVYYLAVEVFQKKRHIQTALGIFIFTSLATCLDAIIQFHITQKDIFFGRMLSGKGATAGFKTYNNLGAYLTMAFPVVLSRLLFINKKKVASFLWGIVFTVVLWATVVTFSRGAWLGILFGVLLVLLAARRKIIFPILIAVVLAAACFYSFIPAQTQEGVRLSTGNILRTLECRTDLWAESIRMIGDKPIFGHGLNTYMFLFQFYREVPRFDPTYAHNCYIQMTAEIGLVGLACFLWIIFALLGRVGSTVRAFLPGRDGSGNFSIFLFGLFSGTAAFLAQSFLDTNFYALQVSILFWLMVGLLVNVYNVLNNDLNRDINLVQ